jgi:hypothetical protein
LNILSAVSQLRPSCRWLASGFSLTVLAADDGFNPLELDFCHLEIDGIESVSDVLAQAHRLYACVETQLRTKERRSDGTAAADDAGVAALNMTGIQSLSMELSGMIDWLKAHGVTPPNGFAAPPFRQIDIRALKRAAVLVKSNYGEHLVVCRNILYMALQAGEKNLAAEMAAHIARLLGRHPDPLIKFPEEVWTYEICGRTPLADEPAISHLIPSITLKL